MTGQQSLHYRLHLHCTAEDGKFLRRVNLFTIVSILRIERLGSPNEVGFARVPRNDRCPRSTEQILSTSLAIVFNILGCFGRDSVLLVVLFGQAFPLVSAAQSRSTIQTNILAAAFLRHNSRGLHVRARRQLALLKWGSLPGAVLSVQ